MIWGIDAGVEGAISLLYEDGRFCAVFDMPIRLRAAVVRAQYSRRRSRSTSRAKNELDDRAARAILAGIGPVFDGLPGDRMRDLVVIELVNAMPHAKRGDKERTAGSKGSVSAASFYRMMGQLEGIACGLGREVKRLTPQEWRAIVMPTTPLRRAVARAVLGVTASTTKNEALAVARRLYPEAPLELQGHDGRADAILVARAGWLLERDARKRLAA